MGAKLRTKSLKLLESSYEPDQIEMMMEKIKDNDQ